RGGGHPDDRPPVRVAERLERIPGRRSGRSAGRQTPRIRLFLASWVTSASPSASSSGGMYTPNRPRRPFFRPYHPPRGLASDRPHASTDPSGAGFCSSAPPRGTQSPCAFSQAWSSSIARASYRSFVPPTWQTIVAGSDASSRYIVYSDVPDGGFRIHGSSFVPVRVAIDFSSCSPAGRCPNGSIRGCVTGRLP